MKKDILYYYHVKADLQSLIEERIIPIVDG